MPFDGYFGSAIDTARYLQKLLSDESSGIDYPAAILVETVQGEGGINVARKEWLRAIQAIANEVGALFVFDDIQMGCGRTGDFFSFEFAGLSPDIIAMSKSLSGYGLPLSMLLIKEEFDAWQPAEHTGTFRGNNLALASATAAINTYWRDSTFSKQVQRIADYMRRQLEVIASKHGNGFVVRGRGMALGFDCQVPEVAATATRKAFEKGVMLERCGPADQVVKFIPALTIDQEIMDEGLELFERALAETLHEVRTTPN